MKRARTVAVLLALAGLALAAPDASAQRSGGTTRIIVPFPPGGTADVIARLVGQAASTATGQTFLIENRPGAGTIIGTSEAARAAPDGNTLLIVSNSFIINPSVRASLPYDPLTSFEPLCFLADSPQVVVVQNASPYRTLGDFIAAAKAKPGELSYATVGPATTQHIAGEVLRRAAGIELTYVPFTGGAPAVNAILGGHVTMVLANYNEVMEQLKAGTLRPLAVSTPTRMAALPDVPTIAESGFKDYEASAYFGVVTPAKTPPETVARVSQVLSDALKTPEVQSKLEAQGLISVGTCGPEFAAYVRKQFDHYARVIKEAGIKSN
jgi:tripartite-type tricarboxylate transporter receptor subunit TctC